MDQVHFTLKMDTKIHFTLKMEQFHFTLKMDLKSILGQKDPENAFHAQKGPCLRLENG